MMDVSEQGAVPQNLAKEVVQALSKEIETATNNMMVFRSKISFGLVIGPFLLLGSFVVNAKGNSVKFEWDWWGIGAAVSYCICFIGISRLCGTIEQQAWRQCNKWRQLIGELHSNPQLAIKESRLKVKDRIKYGYTVGYLLLLASVICTVIIMTKVRVTPTPLESPSHTNPSPNKAL